MRQIRAEEHQITRGKFREAVTDKPPSPALEDEGQLTFGMEMPRGLETVQREFPHGKGMQMILGNQLKLSLVRNLHRLPTLALTADPCKFERVNTIAVFSRAGGDARGPL